MERRDTKFENPFSEMAWERERKRRITNQESSDRAEEDRKLKREEIHQLKRIADALDEMNHRADPK